MQQNRTQVLRWIGLSEGGFVDHPQDPGGATDRGITQATYDAWNKRRGSPPRSVRGISKVDADCIISIQYFDPIQFDSLPPGLDYALADYAVNSGVRQAVSSLQKVLGVKRDGIMGQITLAAIAEKSARELIGSLCEERMRFLRQLRGWKTFGKGWTTRVDDVRQRALSLAQGAVNDTIPEHNTGTPKATPDPAPGLPEAFKDPMAVLPGVGAVLAPLASGNGPIQWAVAALILAAVVAIIWRTVKRNHVDV